MAWNIGEFITQSRLNVENRNYGKFSGQLGDSADWIQNSIGNNGQVYSHAAAGSVLFQGRFDCGWLGGGKFRIKKWVNGGWNETRLARDFGWNTHETVTATSSGEGLYRIYSETAFQFAAIPWTIWFGQTSFIAGQKIVKWDDKFSSLGTREAGARLTVAQLQSGYIGSMWLQEG